MESQTHINLVNRLIVYAKGILPESDHIMIQSDSAGNTGSTRVVGNYIPDLYFCCKDDLIIGEAKNIDDFDRKHSRDQFESYICECQVFDGKSKLLVAVPWQLMCTAKNYFKRLKQKKELQFEIVIINELGKETKI